MLPYGETRGVHLYVLKAIISVNSSTRSTASTGPGTNLQVIHSAYALHPRVFLSAQQYMLPLQRGIQAFGPKVHLLAYNDIRFRVRIGTMLYKA